MKRHSHVFIYTSIFISAVFSSLANADWFFRGTPNNWNTTAMTTVTANQVYTCQTFAGGDSSGGPRFKIDKTGNWSQSFPVADYVVQANQSYYIRFFIDTKTISIEAVSGCSSASSAKVASSKPADSWFFRGTPNNWGATPMTLEAGLFCTQQTFLSATTNPRFKIDHSGNWVESYPQADYIVLPNSTYRICFNPLTRAITANSNNASVSSSNVMVSSSIVSSSLAASSQFTSNAQSSREFSKSSASSSSNNSTNPPPSAMDFRKETIYFLLTARFYDGDSSNNYYNRDRYKAGDPQWRGDFKGLISKLDYIKDLGFTAIWITPPVENRSGLDYHGYHTYDLYKVDPRLESVGASYKNFIDAAHAKGLKVIQDVVINHSSQYGLRNAVWIDHLPLKYYVPNGGAQGNILNGSYAGNLGDYKSAFRDDNDNPVAPQWFRDRHNSDAAGIVPLVDPKTGVSVPKAGYNPNRFFGIDAATLDPNWYHLDGFIAGGDWENPVSLQRKHLAGDTIDLATERQNVKDYINGAMHQYLDMGVDAIRLDTVKHIERNELLSYVNDWKAYKPGLFVFGENLVKGTGLGSELANDNASAVIRPWWYTRTTNSPSDPRAGGDSGFSVLDFSVFSTFRDNLTKGHFGGLGGILGWDWIYGDATNLVTFFQNHDVGPDNDFKFRYGGDIGNAAMAYNFLWTNRGIPTLYYGEEIMFQGGLAQDISGNNDTLDQTGRAYFGDALDNPTTPQHALYQHIKRLNQIRSAVPALQKAATTQVNEWGAGMSFVRDLSSQGSYAVVGLVSGAAQSVSVSGVRNGNYVDAVTGNRISVNDGTLRFNVASYSAGVYVLNGAGKIGDSGQFLR
jgi:glycosidase